MAIGEILEGADTHSLNQVAFSLPSRLIAKIYLFRTIFRGSGYSFANDPDFMHVSTSPKYWEDVNEKFYAKYHGLDKKHQEWCKTVVAGKPIVGPLGRFWPIELGTDYKGDIKIPWTTLTNYPIQGTGADVMMMARIIFFSRLNKRPHLAQCKLISSVHDSIVVDAPGEHRDEIVQLFHDSFKAIIPNIKKVFGYEWRVPLTCECKAGPNMKDLDKVV